MPDVAASLRALIGADTSALARGMTQADALVKQGAQQMQASAKGAGAGIGESMGAGLTSALTTALSVVGISASFAGLIQAGREVFSAWEDAAKSSRIGESFKEQFGVTAVAGLDKLRAASRGTIDDMNLMLAANKAAMLGVSTDADTLAKLLQVAAMRGRALGVGTQQAFSDIVTGIGRMSPLILDNLGIITGGEKAFAAYAKTLGKTAAELTDVERKTFLVSKVLEGVGPVTDDALSSTERLGSAWANMRVELGKSIHAEVAIDIVAKFVAGATKEAATGREFMDPYRALIAERDKTTTGYGGREYERDTRALYAVTKDLTDGTITLAEANARLQKELGLTDEQMVGMAVATAQAASGLVNYGALMPDIIAQVTGLGAAIVSLPTWVEMHIALTGADEAMQKILLLRAVTGGYGTVAQGVALPAGVPERGPGGDAWLAGRQGLKLQTTVADQIARDAAATQATIARIAEATRGGAAAGKSAAAEAKRLAEESKRDMQSMVESILQPSTARYAGGKYVDAWDEYARRLKSAVSDPKSKWKDLLGGRGGKEAEAFAAEQEEAFYAGLRPDLIDWAAFDAAYAHLLEVKRGREALVQAAMARVGGKGGKGDVMAALGIKGGADAAGLDLAAGFATGLATANLAKPMTEAFQKQLAGEEKNWIGMGRLSMNWFVGGLKEGTTKQVQQDIARALFPAFYELLMAREARP